MNGRRQYQGGTGDSVEGEGCAESQLSCYFCEVIDVNGASEKL